MIRFFTKPQNISNGTILLSREDSEHIRSLRLRPGEFFVVCDENGNDYICKLEEQINTGGQNKNSVAQIIEKRVSNAEPSVKCTVYMAYSKGDRLDYAVQKSVELGATEIVLFASKRCVAVPSNIPKKTERLQRISLETAKQSGRGIVPMVSDGGGFKDILDIIKPDEASLCSTTTRAILFYEDESQIHLKDVLELNERSSPDISSYSIITGPEGGFDLSEIYLAKTKGFAIVSLGNRILRSETAPVVALSAIMYQTGNL
ncbi:MAG: 16S rRNA (uracil(1498)-N(3))-methyltransferase [Oscillospiraceae bacterium]|nr:16S rRNA (uracil(1498)-N(3))-methyltransferase [Oscillospiraceae bacterium]